MQHGLQGFWAWACWAGSVSSVQWWHSADTTLYNSLCNKLLTCICKILSLHLKQAKDMPVFFLFTWRKERGQARPGFPATTPPLPSNISAYMPDLLLSTFLFSFVRTARAFFWVGQQGHSCCLSFAFLRHGVCGAHVDLLSFSWDVSCLPSSPAPFLPPALLDGLGSSPGLSQFLASV